jgi:alkylation response protein AidB-like acyl-CoA dehydrogenase
METVLDHHTLEVVRALGPLARDYAEQAERERRVAAPVIEAMKGAGLFRLFVPRSLGGLEVD